MAANFEEYHALRGRSAVHKGGYARRAEEVRRNLSRVLGPDPEAVVVDIGTADGIMLDFLQAAFPRCRFFGVEKNASLLAEAKGLNVTRADARSLPFAQGRFSAALLVSTLKHIPQADAVLREAHRVLAPGGALIVSDPTPWGIRLGLWRGHFDPRYLAHKWSLAELGRRVEQAGFQVEAGYRYMPLPVPLPGSGALEAALRGVRATRWFMQQIIRARRRTC